MGSLVGLPGVKGGKIDDVPFARTVSGAMQALATHRAVNGAGDHGAWCVWRDDEGALRVAYSRYCSIVNTETFALKSQVREWLKAWMPKCERGAQ